MFLRVNIVFVKQCNTTVSKLFPGVVAAAAPGKKRTNFVVVYIINLFCNFHSLFDVISSHGQRRTANQSKVMKRYLLKAP